MKTVGYIGAFLGGAIAGAAIGLLLAPEKGTDTRKKLSGTIEDFCEKHRPTRGSAEALCRVANRVCQVRRNRQNGASNNNTRHGSSGSTRNVAYAYLSLFCRSMCNGTVSRLPFGILHSGCVLPDSTDNPILVPQASHRTTVGEVPCRDAF